MGLFRKGIRDNAKEFYDGHEFESAQIIITKYLAIWFKQYFDDPSFNPGVYPSGFHLTMAAAVSGRLLGKDMSSLVGVSHENLADVRLARKHMGKWADDVMEKDANLRIFVIQTLRMHMIYQQFLNGEEWIRNDPEGKRISQLIEAYGEGVGDTPDPKTYRGLLSQWIRWDNEHGDDWK